jgi:putative thioredoxin
MTKNVIKVDDGNFKREVLEKSKQLPVVVDFWADWCMPCRILGPVIEEVAQENNGKFVLAKMSVEENKVMPSVYSVMSIPSVKMFRNGRVTAEFVGAQPKDKIREWLRVNLE